MNLLFDLKYAYRLLIKSWGYSLMCASVVALSVGLAVWTNALTYSQLWKPLPFAGSEQWYSVQLAPDATGKARPSIDAFTWQEMVKRNRVTQHLGGFTTRAVVLSEGEATTSLRGSAISPSLLSAMQTTPHLGRTFAPTDGKSGAAAVAILSFDTWQNYFAADPAVIGKTARIDATPVQIVGVMPKEFFAIEDFELWMPLQLPTLARPQDSTMTVTPFILLGEGQNLNDVENELKAAVGDVNSDYPQLLTQGVASN